ncbi:MAG: M23 family metallopeptidase [Myxococcaceae bacterium]|nr:M23 family metallopeptidase [Myxococcaceae bacterium]
MRLGAVVIVLALGCATAPREREPLEAVLGAPRRGDAAAEPIATEALLERLQAFVALAERARTEASPGAPMPEALAAEWLTVLEDVDQLTHRASATTLDLVRARLWLQTALEADGARFGDVPRAVATDAQRTLASLTRRLVERTRGWRRWPADPSRFRWPVEPVVVTSPWGQRTHPIHGDDRFHAGIDLEATRAQPVIAASAGVVSFVGWNGGHGKQVELQHDAHLTTSYSHLSDYAVRPGDVVRRGDVIGWAGRTGTATGVHLHFELRRDGEPLDPEAELPGLGASSAWAASP